MSKQIEDLENKVEGIEEILLEAVPLRRRSLFSWLAALLQKSYAAPG